MSLILDGTNGVSDIDGSAATPAVRGVDANTGMFFGTDIVGLSTGGAERMRIDSSGNVGIGTSSPSLPLDIVSNSSSETVKFRGGPTNVATLRFNSNDGATNYSAIQSRSTFLDIATSTAIPLTFSTNSAERMRIDSAGNVGIGTSSPSYKLTLSGTGTQTISLNSTDTGTGAMGLIQLSDDLSFYRGSEGGSGISRSILLNAAATNGTVKFNTAGSERMRITSAGEVLVGGTTEIGSSSGYLTVQKTNDAAALLLFRNDTSISSDNVFGSVSFYGNDTTSNAATLHAAVQARASGTHAAGDNPTDIVFFTTPDGTATVAEAGRITQSGAYVLKGGTTAPGGVGITFPATQNASSNANTLDDYEEGTWTPTLVAGSGCSNLSSNNCRYTKIGSVVICTANITGDSSGGTVNFTMTGPFPMAAIQGVGQLGTVSIYPYAGTYKQSGYVLDNSGGEDTSMFVECYASTSFSGGTFRVSLSYQTSA